MFNQFGFVFAGICLHVNQWQQLSRPMEDAWWWLYHGSLGRSKGYPRDLSLAAWRSIPWATAQFELSLSCSPFSRECNLFTGLLFAKTRVEG